MARLRFLLPSLALIVAGALFFCRPESPAATLAQGRKAYEINCQTCHGETGAGDGLAARLGVAGVANLRSPEARALSDQAIADIIVHGKGKMEGDGETLSSAQRRAIVAYVRSLQTP